MLVFCLHSSDVNCQSYSSIDEITKAYYTAVSMGDTESRNNAYTEIFTASGTITSVKTASTKPSTVKTLNWSDLIRETAPFYKDYEINLVEEDREVDFYLDVAAVHVIVNQRSKQKNTGKTFSQFLWIDIDLVYFNNRWYISAVNWIDQSPSQSINNAMLTDTLWHQAD
jgi:hypothetical protein